MGVAGPTGPTGAQGNSAGLHYNFDTSTTIGELTQGVIRFDSATISSVTTVAIDDLDIYGTNYSDYIGSWGDSTSTIKGYLSYAANDVSDATSGVFEVLGAARVGGSSYWEIIVQNGVGTLPSNNEPLVITFSRTGDLGDVGPTGATGSTGPTGPTGATTNVTSSIMLIIDGGGSAITTGIKGDIEVPFACTITAWEVLADQSGSIVIDVWKDTYANFPPTVGDTITGTEKPTLSSAAKNQDTNLTSWTTSVSANDILRFNVDSATTVTRVTLSLTVTRT
jgi:hypothetical protein